MYDSTTARAPIEAGSLSSLTALATDPPLNPRQPSVSRREPLTLYLARVPGSRDVFLTPLKPRAKTVTAEDVESCLYYMHFESAQDDDVLSALKIDHDNDTARHPQQRPLPATPEERPALPPRPRDSHIWNVPAPSAESQSTKASLRRKPVPVGAPVLHNDRSSIPLEQQDMTDLSLPPPLPARPASKVSCRTPSPDRTAPTAVLVRRDPSSAMQWNVAKIIDPPVHDVSSASYLEGAPPRRNGSPLYLEVFTQGYRKFISASSSSSEPVGIRRRGSTPESIPSLAYSNTSQSTMSAESDNGIFRRRMWMEGSHFFGGRSHDRRSSNVDYSEEALAVTTAIASNGNHALPLVLGNTLRVTDDGRLAVHGDRRSAVKGYAFLSPWQGRCEFTASTLGSSLKCRHRLPGLSQPTGISELRFNLPSRSGHRKSSSHSSIVEASPLRPQDLRDRRAHSVSSLMDEFDGTDLSLGRELAGGGATGKRTKLGKLIIEHEGLQMLDLVVAANMGLWLRAYGRTVDLA